MEELPSQVIIADRCTLPLQFGKSGAQHRSRAFRLIQPIEQQIQRPQPALRLLTAESAALKSLPVFFGQFTRRRGLIIFQPRQSQIGFTLQPQQIVAQFTPLRARRFQQRNCRSVIVESQQQRAQIVLRVSGFGSSADHLR